MQYSNFTPSSDNGNFGALLASVICGHADLSACRDWLRIHEGELCEIPENILIQYIYITVVRKKYRKMLNDVIEALSDSSVTETTFNMLYYYPERECREQVCISLCHMKLNYRQLYLLCQTELTDECYYTLGEQLYWDNDISVQEYDNFMKFFSESKFREHIPFLVHDFISPRGDRPKDEVLARYL